MTKLLEKFILVKTLFLDKSKKNIFRKSTVMKKHILILASAIFVATFFACGDGNKKVEEQEKKAVETQVAKDQVAMDSLEKAIKAQIDAVDDDSLMKAEH